MSYRAEGENVYQFGPAAGSSPGMTLSISVTVLGLSGLRNAYTSVLSAVGSCAISGASRWLDACALDGPPRSATAATTAASAAARATSRSALIASSPYVGRPGRPSVSRSVRRCERTGSTRSPGNEPESRRRRMDDVKRELAHLSDEALVALAARSEQAALGELYDRYGRAAYGLALRVLRDESLAEDAVQDAFLSVWRTASRFVPERGTASTWILTLVHRRAVDIVRREQ